jgi:hypothetical protein
MKQQKSNIPSDVVERLVSEYRQEGRLIYYRITNCLLHGQVVGQRHYTQTGTMVRETPLKDGQKHGREYTWNDDGSLILMEPYVQGKIHGTAEQYGAEGKVIGTYHIIHGTGLDIWREEDEAGNISIAEIHSLRDGLPHGYTWWLITGQNLRWHEQHWQAGQLHGIERMWNQQGKLRRGYPKYWITGQTVSKQKYLQTIQDDQTLPPYDELDNSQQRQFPLEIKHLLSSYHID